MKSKEYSEYSALRNELVSKQEQKRSVWLHMYILYLSLFVLGFEISHYMFLLTFIVLIPYQAVLNNLEWNVSRISAYIQVFYETEQTELRWETMNTHYTPYTHFLKQRCGGISRFVRIQNSIHLGLLSTALFIYHVLSQDVTAKSFVFHLSPKGLLASLAALVLLFILILENCNRYTKCDPELKTIIKKYKNYIDKSNNLSQD